MKGKLVATRHILGNIVNFGGVLAAMKNLEVFHFAQHGVTVVCVFEIVMIFVGKVLAFDQRCTQKRTRPITAHRIVYQASFPSSFVTNIIGDGSCDISTHAE